MTNIEDQYFIHFFLAAKKKGLKKELHIAMPLILRFDSKEEAISFLESQSYKHAPVLKNLNYNFCKQIDSPHGEVNIYATVSYLTTAEKLTDFVNNISEMLS